MAIINVRFSEAEVKAFLDDPEGPVAHLMEELGGRAAVFARAKVPKRLTGSPGKSGRPGDSAPPLSTLHSIDSALHATGANTPWSEVSSDIIGLFLEKGTRPHTIRSHGPWSLSNEKTGYFGRVVYHPGTTPHPFLTEALWSLQGQV